MEGTAEYQRNVHQRWLLEAFPTPAQIVAFVEAMEPTMAVPLRRYVAWGDPTRELKGSWAKSRDKLLVGLRDGFRGEAIRVLLIHSYNYRGSNFNVGSEISFAPNFKRLGGLPDTATLLECARRLEDGDRPEQIAGQWAGLADEHLSAARILGDHRVKREKVTVWP